MSKWCDSRVALALLGVRPQTLYASVSRGRIRSKADNRDTRRRLYSREDVMRWAARRPGPRKASQLAQETMTWGEAVLPSAVSTVAQGRLWYRGRDALLLAADGTLEQTAALLWQLPVTGFGAPSRGSSKPGDTARHAGLHRGLICLATLAAHSPPSQARTADAPGEEAARIVASLADALAGPFAAGRGRPLHARIATAYDVPRAADSLRKTLVLLADHELNASTFATRVAISTGASLAAGVLAGLATLSGPMHGGAAESLRTLAAQCKKTGVKEGVCEWLARGLPLPAFGHPLYPEGDSRVPALLDGLRLPPLLAAIRDEVEQTTGEAPNVDFALLALAEIYRLPRGAPLALFAIARSVGWIAHALEQRAASHLIRPRARYCGPPLPGTAAPALPGVRVSPRRR